MNATGKISPTLREYRALSVATYAGQVWALRLGGAVLAVCGVLYVVGGDAGPFTFVTFGLAAYLLFYYDLRVALAWRRLRDTGNVDLSYALSDESLKLSGAGCEMTIRWDAISGCTTRKAAWVLTAAVSKQPQGVARAAFSAEDQVRIDQFFARGGLLEMTDGHATGTVPVDKESV